MANRPSLTITPFKNPSGAIAWRLSGTVRGERIRKNFKLETEAQAKRNQLLSSMASEAIPAPVLTRLTQRQVQEAEAAFLELPEGAKLSTAIRFWKERALHLRANRALEDVSSDWEHWLLVERKAKPETAASWKGVIAQFGRQASCKTIYELSAEKAMAWVHSAKAVRSQRDRYDVLAYFARWAKQKGHSPDNPFERIERPVVKNRPAPNTFTPTQVEQLLQAAIVDSSGPSMLPYLAMACLSGVRPEEIPDLDNDAVWLEEHQIIEVNRTKGGRSRRNAEICQSLLGILTWCKTKGLKFNFFSRRQFRRIRERAGLVEPWEKDVCRHTYASAHYAAHKDIKRLTSSMGNSEKILFAHYIRPWPKADGERLLSGLKLDFDAPRAQSAEGARYDVWKKHPRRLSEDKLRLLLTHSQAELARARRNAPDSVADIEQRVLEIHTAIKQKAASHEAAS